jgi:hypothetical protein
MTRSMSRLLYSPGEGPSSETQSLAVDSSDDEMTSYHAPADSRLSPPRRADKTAGEDIAESEPLGVTPLSRPAFSVRQVVFSSLNFCIDLMMSHLFV